VQLLLEWNSKINLVSRRDEGNVWFSHVLHSLSLLFIVNLPRDGKVLDLGTGGGFPGIPLAIARPDLKLVLIDSVAKKVRAVEDMVARIGLMNVHTLCLRAEELGRGEEFVHAFDVVVARAVAPLDELVRWSRPLLKLPDHLSGAGQTVGTPALPHDISSPYLLCMKGGDLEGEIQRARVKAGAAEIHVFDLVINGGPVPPLEDKKVVVVRP